MSKPVVAGVSISPLHGFSKTPRAKIVLVAGLGVEGDAHAGETVRHRSRVARNPAQPNLRQVHLLEKELLDELAESGFALEFGSLGENITTSGLSLLDLSRDTILHLGSATVRITGLRNPCGQIENYRPGLLGHVLMKSANGDLIRRAGVMAVVEHGGIVCPGDAIAIKPPDGSHVPLSPV